MKRILVTGACGFIGSFLTEMLVENKYEVVAFDRYNSFNNYGNLEFSKYKKEIKFILGDIRDFDSVSKSLAECDAVIHLAALVGIPYSYISPLAYVKTNIEGTYNVLEAARLKNIKQIIIVSTSETYGTAQIVPINENHPKVAQSPYAASKIASDQLAMSYFKSFGMPIKIARPFNTYGPRQSARAIIPTIISQILDKHPILNLGNLYPTRDFTYVTDTCNAFIEILKKDIFIGEEVNIGTNTEISINDLANKIKKIMNSNINIVSKKEKIRPNQSEVDRLVCDNKKIIKLTNWNPNVNIEDGLENCINWVSNFRNYYKSDIYNI